MGTRFMLRNAAAEIIARCTTDIKRVVGTPVHVDVGPNDSASAPQNFSTHGRTSISQAQALRCCCTRCR